MNVFVILDSFEDDGYPAAVFSTEEAAQEWIVLQSSHPYDYQIEAYTVDDPNAHPVRVTTWAVAKILEVEARQEARRPLTRKQRRPLYDPAYEVRVTEELRKVGLPGIAVPNILHHDNSYREEQS